MLIKNMSYEQLEILLDEKCINDVNTFLALSINNNIRKLLKVKKAGIMLGYYWFIVLSDNNEYFSIYIKNEIVGGVKC